MQSCCLQRSIDVPHKGVCHDRPAVMCGIMWRLLLISWITVHSGRCSLKGCDLSASAYWLVSCITLTLTPNRNFSTLCTNVQHLQLELNVQQTIQFYGCRWFPTFWTPVVASRLMHWLVAPHQIEVVLAFAGGKDRCFVQLCSNGCCLSQKANFQRVCLFHYASCMSSLWLSLVLVSDLCVNICSSTVSSIYLPG